MEENREEVPKELRHCLILLGLIWWKVKLTMEMNWLNSFRIPCAG